MTDSPASPPHSSDAPARLPETYRDCLDFLFARNQFAMKLGLENINALLDRLGRPDRGLRVLHVAGTNGKGSVCANLAALLGACGVKSVGLYTSPHLVSFRERILVDGAPIPRDYIVAWLRKAMPSVLELKSTYFECVTALALDYFRACDCEAVVLETGLGGRLDATNAVQSVISVITSISLDHTHILGNTVDEIWREKIAILKPGVPMVVREDRPPLLAELDANARALGSPVFKLRDHPYYVVGDELRFQGRFAAYKLPATLRREEHQQENLCLSLLAMETFLDGPLPPAATWVTALASSRVPGRTQLLEATGKLPLLLDGAHNPGGIEALAKHIRTEFRGRRVTAVFGVMRDKDYAQVYRGVRAFADEILYAPLEAWYPRALPFADLAAALAPEERKGLRPFDLEPAALAELLRADRPGAPDLLVVCGSLYLLGRVIPMLLPHYPAALAGFAQFADEENC